MLYMACERSATSGRWCTCCSRYLHGGMPCCLYSKTAPQMAAFFVSVGPPAFRDWYSSHTCEGTVTQMLGSDLLAVLLLRRSMLCRAAWQTW